MLAVGADEVESLKRALAEAKKEAEASKVVTDKAAENLEEEKTTRQRHEARVGEVEKELKDAIARCESLEQTSSEQASDLVKARESLKEARANAQDARQEIQEVRHIAAGKAFIMQSRYTSRRYILLTRVRSSPGAFADLPRSIADAAAFFRAEDGSSMEKLFWSQYLAPELPVSLSDQMKQLSELHRMASLAMKDVIVRLWLAEAIPSGHFGLVKKLVEALPRIDALKRSSCIEGARMAFARVKVQWAKMKATEVATAGPPEGKEHRRPERYFDEVLEGARIVEGQCSKDIMFE